MANTKIKPIRAEKDYEELLARIDAFMDAVPGSPELDVLTDLVELYESRHGPMGYPSPLAEIQFRMEQGDLRPRDLIPFTGSRAKVSEVLSGKCAITMSMAHALHKHLGIPADVLLREPDVDLDDPHGRDGHGPPTAGPSGDRRWEDSLRATQLSAAVTVCRCGRSPAAAWYEGLRLVGVGMRQATRHLRAKLAMPRTCKRLIIWSCDGIQGSNSKKGLPCPATTSGYLTHSLHVCNNLPTSAPDAPRPST